MNPMAHQAPGGSSPGEGRRMDSDDEEGAQGPAKKKRRRQALSCTGQYTPIVMFLLPADSHISIPLSSLSPPERYHATPLDPQNASGGKSSAIGSLYQTTARGFNLISN